MEGFKLLLEVRLHFLAVASSTSRHATKFDFRRKLPVHPTRCTDKERHPLR